MISDISENVIIPTPIKLALSIKCNTEDYIFLHSFSFLGTNSELSYDLYLLITNIKRKSSIYIICNGKKTEDLSFDKNGLFVITGLSKFPTTSIMSIYGKGNFMLNEVNISRPCYGCENKENKKDLK